MYSPSLKGSNFIHAQLLETKQTSHVNFSLIGAVGLIVDNHFHKYKMYSMQHIVHPPAFCAN